MRNITILLIITFSFFIVSLAQDNDHSHSTSEHSTEHNSEDHGSDGHGSEHSEMTESEKMDHHGTTDAHTEHSENAEHTDESEATEMDHEHSNSTEDHSEHTSMTDADMSESSEMSHTSGAHSEHSDMSEANNTSDESHNHNNHNEHDDSENSEHDNEHSEHNDHSEHSQSDHSDHSNHSSTMAEGNANSVMLGDKQLTLYPLLSPQGIFQIIVQSDSAGYVTSASFEGKSQLITFDEKGLTTVDLGSAKHGSYTLTFRDDSNVTTMPIDIYKAFTPSGKAFTTIFAPSPSLSTKGQSEVFIYNIADGENQHQLINVNYSMQGMQHSLDDVMTPLMHEHFDGLKSIVSTIETSTPLNPDLLASAMSNRSALSFAMAGTWQFSILVDGEVLTFDIEMLAE